MSRLAVNKILILILFSSLGLIGNYFSITLFFGVDVIFGSVFSMLALMLWGRRMGVLVSIFSSIYTILLWGHPYGCIIFICEIIFMSLFYKPSNQEIKFIKLDVLYWLVIGLPMVLFFYHTVMALPLSLAIMIALKQGINGIFNVLIASTVLILLKYFSTKSKGVLSAKIQIKSMLFTFILLAVFLSGSFTLLLNELQYKTNEVNEIYFMLDKSYEKVKQHIGTNQKLPTRNIIKNFRDNDIGVYFKKGELNLTQALFPENKKISGKQSLVNQSGLYIWLPNSHAIKLKKWGNGVYYIKKKVQLNNQAYGLIFVYPSTKIAEKLLNKRIPNLIMLYLFIIIGYATAQLISFFMTSSLHRLREYGADSEKNLLASTQINSCPRININEYNELGVKLTSAFNSVYFKINENRKLRKNLDKKVQAQIKTITSERLKIDTIIKATDTGVWEWHMSSDKLSCNNEFLNMIGRYKEEVTVFTSGSFIEFIHKDDRANFKDAVLKHINNEAEFFECEIRMIHKDKSILWINSKGKVIQHDEFGAPLVLAGINQNITLKKMSQNKIEYMAKIDPLTQTYNRFYFQTYATTLLVRKKNEALQTACVLMILDLNNFKQVNDYYSHECGDFILKEFVKRVKICLSQNDILSRIGGDEFIVIIDPVVNMDNIDDIAANLIETCSKTYDYNGNKIKVAVSIGIASYPESGESIETLLRHADLALYNAKDNDNKYAYFTDIMKTNFINQQKLEQALVIALEKEQFYFVFQPQVNMKTHSIIGVEALIRWDNSIHNLSTEYFVETLEKMGLAKQLNLYVFKHVTEIFKEFNSNIPNFKLSINFSSLVHDINGDMDEIIEIIDKNKNDSLTYVIEITETSFMETASTNKGVQDFSRKIKSAGYQLAIDDFGVKYSSINRLFEYDFSIIKIDMSFVQKLTNKKFPSAPSIINAIILIADSMSLSVIAEGVETKEQLDTLTALGCHIAQGYYYYKPLTFDELIREIQDNKR